MDRAYLSEVENGKRSLSVDRLLRICRALGWRATDVIAAVEGELNPQRK
jgi:transcriptional regulator with XRE-family HTH domain